MKKFICGLMVLVIMISFAACGKKTVVGTWTTDDGIYSYNFDSLGKTDDGEKMGRVSVQPKSNDLFAGVISYYYRFENKDTIEILYSSPKFTNNGIGVDMEQYDVLRIEEENGKRVLVSTETGKRYYQEKS